MNETSKIATSGKKQAIKGIGKKPISTTIVSKNHKSNNVAIINNKKED